MTVLFFCRAITTGILPQVIRVLPVQRILVCYANGMVFMAD
jgi:hypothetical protein